MKKYLPAFSLGIAAFFLASNSFAIERGALEKSSIKAATDCVAQAALKDPNIITLYRQNRLNELTDWIALRSNVCDKPLTAMRLLHEQKARSSKATEKKAHRRSDEKEQSSQANSGLYAVRN